MTGYRDSIYTSNSYCEFVTVLLSNDVTSCVRVRWEKCLALTNIDFGLYVQYMSAITVDVLCTLYVYAIVCIVLDVLYSVTF